MSNSTDRVSRTTQVLRALTEDEPVGISHMTEVHADGHSRFTRQGHLLISQLGWQIL